MLLNSVGELLDVRDLCVDLWQILLIVLKRKDFIACASLAGRDACCCSKITL